MACFDRELLRLVPKVLRARDFYLYLEGGKRLTDLWRSGGRAVLGHKRPRVLAELKNSAERGLFCAFPHPLEKRFIKALGGLFPGRSFRLYLNESSLRLALDKASLSGPVPIWRPFLENTAAAFFTPVLPFPLGPEVLVMEKNMEDSFPQGELIPPVLLAPAARALHDLMAAIKAGKAPGYRKIEKALCQAQSDGKGIWQRRGIYITTETKGGAYKDLFIKFLEGGFLIPPSPVEPVILPFSMSPGEEAKLAELLVPNP